MPEGKHVRERERHHGIGEPCKPDDRRLDQPTGRTQRTATFDAVRYTRFFDTLSEWAAPGDADIVTRARDTGSIRKSQPFRGACEIRIGDNSWLSMRFCTFNSLVRTSGRADGVRTSRHAPPNSLRSTARLRRPNACRLEALSATVYTHTSMAPSQQGLTAFEAVKMHHLPVFVRHDRELRVAVSFTCPQPQTPSAPFEAPPFKACGIPNTKKLRSSENGHLCPQHENYLRNFAGHDIISSFVRRGAIGFGEDRDARGHILGHAKMPCRRPHGALSECIGFFLSALSMLRASCLFVGRSRQVSPPVRPLKRFGTVPARPCCRHPTHRAVPRSNCIAP